MLTRRASCWAIERQKRWMGISLAGVLRMEGMGELLEHAFRNTLYPSPTGGIHAGSRLLPHVLPIGGSIL